MPWIIGGLVATIFIKEADDLAETLNGQQGGIPVTQMAMIAAAGYVAYRMVKK